MLPMTVMIAGSTRARTLMSPQRCGFTLVEVLVALAIITIGLTAVAAGFQYALDAVEAARRHTTALFLAEQRLEQVKAMALVDFDGVTTAKFPDEDSVVDHPQYRRRVEITPSPAGLAHAMHVQVTVAYLHVAAGPRMVTLATVLSRRR